ncbi:MAG: hypothetical protein FJW09_09540 [Actinobacteria bacterium]|nr:hypothetical protein [Actinomycetota bacterium]
MTTTVLRQTAIGRPITKRGVAIFPVYRPGSSPTDLGLTRPGVGFQIREKASPTVPILEVENANPEPVVLFAGETLEGGRQQRVLNQSVIIAGRTICDIPVSCVEQGRWHGSQQFRGVGEMAPPAIRRSANRRDQGAVWSDVDLLLSSHRLSSDTNSLDEYFRSRPASPDTGLIDEIVSWGPMREQTGIVVMNQGSVVSFDLFGEPDLLASMWDTLIRSAFATEVGPDRARANRADKALQFLRRFEREVRGPLGRSDFGLGEWAQVMSDKVAGQALALDGALVHASAFPTAL